MNHTLISCLEINSTNLKNGHLVDLLPELSTMKKTYEQNAWHNETTFEHVTKIMEKLEEWIYNIPLDIKKYFDEKIENNSKLDLLKIIILLHDIGKTKTQINNNDGTTSFPDHEKSSFQLAPALLTKFNITIKECEYILPLIRDHYLPHQAFKDSLEETDKNFISLKNSFPNIFLELVVFGMLDTQGSKLSEKNPGEFKTRMEQYNKILLRVK